MYNSLELTGIEMPPGSFFRMVVDWKHDLTGRTRPFDVLVMACKYIDLFFLDIQFIIDDSPGWF
jgi:hypothetical protein